MGLGWFVLLLSGFANGAETEVSGEILSDLRARLEDVPQGAWYAPKGLQAGFSRSETVFRGRLRVKGQDVVGVADASAVVNSFAAEIDSFEGMSDRGLVDPVNLELNELYLDLWGVGLDTLDLRVGHQLVQWGVGDQFNPTNNLNADDLEDPLKFGKQLPNAMIRADYGLGPTWTLSAVLVPVFKPAMLPRSAILGLASTERLPMVEEELRWKLHAEQALARDWALLGYPTIVSGADPQLPGSTFSDAQWMVRLGGSVGMQDLALSWYDGRSDIPQPVKNHTQLIAGERCHPSRESDCIKGILSTEAQLAYPRMQVAGLNAAGEVNLLGFAGMQPFGWRFELAYTFPERLVVAIENDALDLGALAQPAGEYDYGLGGERPTVIEDRPFAKWTLGLDYTLGKHVYTNAQWVHGLPDEFGAGDFLSEGWTVRDGGVTGPIDSTVDCVVTLESGETCAWETLRHRIGDYAVLGTDLTMGPVLLRVFGILDVTGYVGERWSEAEGRRVQTRHHPFSPDGFSAVLYPELMVKMGGGMEAAIGTVQLFGKRHTKFGDPAAGGDLAFVRGAYRF
jgi:hypothetical protein